MTTQKLNAILQARHQTVAAIPEIAEEFIERATKAEAGRDDLLAAMKVAEFAVQQAADSRQIPEEDRAALHMIRTAIAKAEGRA